MLHRSLTRIAGIFAIIVIIFNLGSLPADAANVDSYVARFLHVNEPIALEINSEGETRPFSPQDLSSGKKLFESNCINCHVGGATLPDPAKSLALKTLSSANPPRNNISSLVTFLRQPMTYDGSEETYWCRQVPESWLSKTEVENLAAFVLTAAQKAPGWGAESF
jgi:photosystem II cytochrome c550